MSDNGNMELWNSVCETPPSTTRPVEYGNRKFTAIDAQHQRKRATEVFGPYGDGWGLKDLKWEYVREKEKIVELTLDAIFWCVLIRDGEPVDFEFPIASDHRYKPGDDLKKKLITDATTKALSMLGFNSDVFEGKFDDNKYVEKQDFREARKKKFEDIVKAIKSCKDTEQLKKYVTAYQDQWKAEFSDHYQAKIQTEIDGMSSELEGQEVF